MGQGIRELSHLRKFSTYLRKEQRLEMEPFLRKWPAYRGSHLSHIHTSKVTMCATCTKLMLLRSNKRISSLVLSPILANNVGLESAVAHFAGYVETVTDPTLGAPRGVTGPPLCGLGSCFPRADSGWPTGRAGHHCCPISVLQNEEEILCLALLLFGGLEMRGKHAHSCNCPWQILRSESNSINRCPRKKENSQILGPRAEKSGCGLCGSGKMLFGAASADPARVHL